jgi:hypothetical protein
VEKRNGSSVPSPVSLDVSNPLIMKSHITLTVGRHVFSQPACSMAADDLFAQEYNGSVG